MADEREQFEDLIRFMRDARGFDFAGYKRSTLMRRTVKRMREVGATSFEEYRRHLESSPDEFVMLFNTILINVTSFFRDKDAWRLIGDELVPKLIESSDGPIRIWSAGCATGQEPFSIAMLFARAYGDLEIAQRVKIYATDLSGDGADGRRRTAPHRAAAAPPWRCALGDGEPVHRAGVGDRARGRRASPAVAVILAAGGNARYRGAWPICASTAR